MQRRRRRFSGSTKSWRIRLVRADWEHGGIGRAVGHLCGADWGSSWASPAWISGLGMLLLPSGSRELVPQRSQGHR